MQQTVEQYLAVPCTSSPAPYLTHRAELWQPSPKSHYTIIRVWLSGWKHRRMSNKKRHCDGGMEKTSDSPWLNWAVCITGSPSLTIAINWTNFTLHAKDMHVLASCVKEPPVHFSVKVDTAVLIYYIIGETYNRNIHRSLSTRLPSVTLTHTRLQHTDWGAAINDNNTLCWWPWGELLQGFQWHVARRNVE